VPGDDLTYNADHKYDLQLSQAKIDERRLGALLLGGKIELKSESWLWERTGNICVEYARDGRPSGIASTEADVWAHELKAVDGSTVGYFLIPVPRLKELCRAAYRAGRFRLGGGDGGRFDVVLLTVADLLKTQG
jgi:hypothetical protein